MQAALQPVSLHSQDVPRGLRASKGSSVSPRSGMTTSGRMSPQRRVKAASALPHLSGPQELPALVAPPSRLTRPARPALRQPRVKKAATKSRGLPCAARSPSRMQVLREAALKDAARLLDSGRSDRKPDKNRAGSCGPGNSLELRRVHGRVPQKNFEGQGFQAKARGSGPAARAIASLSAVRREGQQPRA